MTKTAKSHYDQDYSGGQKGVKLSSSSGARTRGKVDHNLDMDINIDVEPALDQSDQDEGIEDLYENIGEDFDNIDVDVDIDVNHKAKEIKQMALAADEYDDDYLQDDIPIDDDDEDDEIIDGMADDLDDQGYSSKSKSTSKIDSNAISSSPSLKAS